MRKNVQFSERNVNILAEKRGKNFALKRATFRIVASQSASFSFLGF